jgi:hypothetical protein
MGSVTADLEFSASLQASISQLAATVGQLGARLDRQMMAEREANEAFRQVEFAGTITLTAGAGTLQDFNRFGCPSAYFWSIRRLTAQGFTAGTVTAYRDSTSGEPLCPFAAAAVNTFGKGELVVKSMSQIVWSAASITGTVSVWGVADQFYAAQFPWYMGVDRGAR